jgi:ABC-type lipoprotein export system ATPase subunit
MVTHDVDAAKIADKRFRLNYGKLIEEKGERGMVGDTSG